MGPTDNSPVSSAELLFTERYIYFETIYPFFNIIVPVRHGFIIFGYFLPLDLMPGIYVVGGNSKSIVAGGPRRV